MAVAVALVVGVAGQGEASPIRGGGRVRAQANTTGSGPWDASFVRALQRHWMHVVVPKGVHIEAVNGLLPQSPLVSYLEWRRSLDPSRFDRYHPRIGALIAQDLTVRADALPAPTVPTLLPPVLVRDQGNPPPPVLIPAPQTVPTPEPSTAVVLACLLGTAATARRWRRRARRPVDCVR
jgi:hypothetical protein